MHKCRACVASLSQQFRLRFFQFPGHKAKLNLSQTATSSEICRMKNFSLGIDVGKTGIRISWDGHDTIPSKSRARSAQSCVFTVINQSAAFCHLHYHHPSCSLYVWLAFACCFLCLCHHNKSLSHQYLLDLGSLHYIDNRCGSAHPWQICPCNLHVKSSWKTRNITLVHPHTVPAQPAREEIFVLHTERLSLSFKTAARSEEECKLHLPY